jgi:hypothetical protein
MQKQIKAKRGFAAMSPERQREFARRGGKAAQAKGTGHRWDGEEAKRVGRIGGMRGKGRVREQLV